MNRIMKPISKGYHQKMMKRVVCTGLCLTGAAVAAVAEMKPVPAPELQLCERDRK